MYNYHNGNCYVTLASDGTKIREWPDGTDPEPVFPDAIDVKITNICYNECRFCHESSRPEGIHGSWSPEHIQHLFGCLPAGVELALGGGDPLTHPGLEDLLEILKELGLVANMTVHGSALQQHAFRRTQLDNFLSRHRIHGLGATYCNTFDRHYWVDRVVVHYIVGIHTPSDVLNLPDHKKLILGFKNTGRGASYFIPPSFDSVLEMWRYWLPSILEQGKVSFDTLALEQLQVRDFINPEVWNQSYMGDDGEFTMYLDLVTNTYGVSSTGRGRFPVENKNVAEMFHHVRSLRSSHEYLRTTL